MVSPGAGHGGPWARHVDGEPLSPLRAEEEHDPAEDIPLGPETDAFPSGLSRAPFRWQYGLESHAMEFLGGFVGVRQDPGTLALRPEIGWAVRSAS